VDTNILEMLKCGSRATLKTTDSVGQSQTRQLEANGEPSVLALLSFMLFDN
jgi:hypothetical protein